MARATGSRWHLLASIKAIHTLAWSSIESCMGYVLYEGFARRSDRRAGIADDVLSRIGPAMDPETMGVGWEPSGP